MLELNLPAFGHKIKKKDGRLFIWDAIRRKYIVLQPEEWVRQHFVNYLVAHKNVPAARISLEYGNTYNSRSKRCDIVVWDDMLRPLILVECKACHVEINDEVFFQAATYYSQVPVKFIVLTNGLVHVYYKKTDSGLIITNDIPDFTDLE